MPKERLASDRTDLNIKGRVQAIVNVQRTGPETPPTVPQNDPSKEPWAK